MDRMMIRFVFGLVVVAAEVAYLWGSIEWGLW